MSQLASVYGLRRPMRARSVTGGFHSTNRLGPRGAPSLSITRSGTPVRRSPNSPGFAMVADVQMNWGSTPRSRHNRRRRRSTSATWLPNTPRYTCMSSSTTYRSARRNGVHRKCCGRMPTCSMSGLVSRICALGPQPAPGVLGGIAVVRADADGKVELRRARPPGPARGPWSDRETAHAPSGPRRGPRARAARSTASCRWRCRW